MGTAGGAGPPRPPDDDERQALAEELRQVREAVAARPVPARAPLDVLGAPRAVTTPSAHERPEVPARTVPQVPDGSAVNAGWDVSSAIPPGPLAALARRLLRPLLDAQSSFNSQQVQLDNRILEYLNARFERTHEHYDAVLGLHGRHMQEIDERHLTLQEDLVAHVHDLVKRIDLVLSEGERSRLSLEAALDDLRTRLRDLEARLAHG